MTKPREFWILGYDHISGSSLAYEDVSKSPHMKENMIHVREVLASESDKAELLNAFYLEGLEKSEVEIGKYREACEVMREALEYLRDRVSRGDTACTWRCDITADKALTTCNELLGVKG